ncbi:unnamed protein product [Rotaria sp. Silwood2]|nr:unnamed protein product [Rotaria sp. Silwood2]CAF4588715.1 unnamed protein product [Rotaria sp. Silwood2]
MAYASSNRLPVLLRPKNFQWYWNSAVDPWSLAEEWMKYADAENEIIEDAYSQELLQVEIDGDWVINLKHQIQYKKNEKDKQRPIKRVQSENDRSHVHLRETRFSLPITLAATRSTPSIEGSQTADSDTLNHLRSHSYIAGTYFKSELEKTSKVFSDVVEAAAEGIMKEGSLLGKTKEAEWLARQLLTVKHYGNGISADWCHTIPVEIGQMCVYLYTKECFWYKLVNKLLRDISNITIDQLKSIGPFCWLLQQYLEKNKTREIITLYRGCELTDEQRKDYMIKKGTITFTAFTSTSRSREKAEQFGNTLFIFDCMNKYFPRAAHPCGAFSVDIAAISDFPNEEEFLIESKRVFQFMRYDYDFKKKKHLIYLMSLG